MATMSDGVTQGPHKRLAIWTTTWSNGAVNSFSGAMAGVASGIVTCPLDVIKTKLQGQASFTKPLKGTKPPVRYHGMLGTARVIVKEDGVRGLYRGLSPMLLGYLPTWAVYMAVYEESREMFYRNGYGSNDHDKLFARIYASVSAGACSTLATNPIWVIKTRLMSQNSKTAPGDARTPWHYDGTLDAVRKMYRAEGMKAFYSGLAPALLGLTHVAIQFPLYEYFKQKFTGLEMGEAPADTAAAGVNTVGILAASFLSKVCATTATYPHEVLRTRLQTQQRVAFENKQEGIAAAAKQKGIQEPPAEFKLHYRGVMHAARTIVKEEGWRAFYNGLGTNLLRAVPAAMTTMLAFESLKSMVGGLQAQGRALQEA